MVSPRIGSTRNAFLAASDPKDAECFSWLRELADYQRQVKNPVEFLETVKMDLFPDEVYVFTPKGDVRVLPRGATPIDLLRDSFGSWAPLFRARANGQSTFAL